MDKEAIVQILQAGMLAPSSKNRQPWKFVVATESAKAEVCQAMKEGIRREKKDPFIPDGIKICDVSEDDVDNDYRKISKDDFTPELYRFINQSEIDDYNNSLPNKEELEKYKDELKTYFQSKEACVRINIGNHNDGTAKSSNVSAEIEFPDGVIVYDDAVLEYK